MAIIDWGPGRWWRKYRLVFLLGLLFILVLQLFLGYHSSNLLELQSEPQTKSGSGPWSSDFKGLKKGLGPVDDDDLPSNSNSYSKGESANQPPHPHHPGKEDFLKSISLDGKANSDLEPQKKAGLTLKDLPFTPKCQVQSRDALSAINRARSADCKRQIVDTVCAIESGTFYAESLTSQCPNGNYSRGACLGCFQDEQTNRLLDGYYVNNKATNSPGKCIELCLQSGFIYAGVQYGSECFCGHSRPPSTAQLADSSCTMKCPGSNKKGAAEDERPCGGYFTMNIYETGISKFEAQPAELKPKDGDPRVKIVFLLTLNGRALRQVKRLIRSLYSPRHYFYIHVDSRQDYLFRELAELEAEFPNIRLTRQRYSTIWGGASLLQMLLSCMRELLTIDEWSWDVVINLSESDFPVKRLGQLEEFLTANKGRNFVKSHGRETQRFIQKQGLDKTFVECDMHMWRVGDRHLPLGIQIDGGSDWVALDRRFVEYVIEGLDNGDTLLEGLLTIFRHTLLPAESFFHTTLRNSEFCNTYVDNNLHFTNWKRKLGCKCQYRHVVDWCGCSPNDFKPDDWPRLEGTDGKQLFFARKFEPIISQAMIQKLEEWLFGVYPGDFVNLKSYWQSVYHYLDHSPKADDALLTVCTSLIRMSLGSHFNGLIDAGDRNKVVDSVKIREVTYYLDEDRYRGFLVKYQMQLAGDHGVHTRLEFEFLAKGSQMIQTNKKSKLAQRISVLEVGSDFDQKEQRARNYGKMLGPFSEPVVVFQLRRLPPKEEAVAGNVTALWIDPVGNIGDISEVHIDDQPNLIYFAKGNLLHPLQPGVWTVKFIYKGTAIALVKFLVVPLQYLHQKRITKAKAQVINLGTENDIKYGNSGDWDRHLMPISERMELMKRAQGNGDRFGAELEQWIDRLVKNFYLIQEYCLVVSAGEEGDNVDSSNGVNLNTDNIVVAGKGSSSGGRVDFESRFEECPKTSWSSLAPDPKSHIRGMSSA